jgi:hypothetical protein
MAKMCDLIFRNLSVQIYEKFEEPFDQKIQQFGVAKNQKFLNLFRKKPFHLGMGLTHPRASSKKKAIEKGKDGNGMSVEDNSFLCRGNNVGGWGQKVEPAGSLCPPTIVLSPRGLLMGWGMRECGDLHSLFALQKK